MTESEPAAADAFTPGERDYIRQELDRFFSTLPSVADGFQLRTWRGGPQRSPGQVHAVVNKAENLDDVVRGHPINDQVPRAPDPVPRRNEAGGHAQRKHTQARHPGHRS